ncbi:hypothetical protein JL720_7041 [Aureococcus anophagefferens]|nr:hypothetical protein JL720_7041 [Aureococcus anophagefferens]
MSQWRIRDLQEMCARRVVACISQDAEGSSLLAQQLCFAPASVLEGLWAYAAESDRLSDALARARSRRARRSARSSSGPCRRRHRAGVTEGVRALPALCGRVVVGWPSHFGATLARWLTRALHERERGAGGDGDRGPRGLGGGQGGVVPATWSRLFGGPSARDDDDVDRGGGGFGDDVAPRSAPAVRRGRSRTAPAADVGLVAFKVSGEAEGRFADALATCAPTLRELRFRDAPAVSDGAAAAPRRRRDGRASTLRHGRGPAADAARGCARLTRLNVDGCAHFGDEALGGVLGGCPGLRDLSCRRCARRGRANMVRAATSGLALASVRVDLRRPAPRAAPAARRDAALALLAADDDFGDDGDDATTDDAYDAADVELALAESLADLAPFDAPFRGSHLRSLRVALVGHARREVRDDWLAALVAKVPASVSEFEARGGWGADLPAASAPALGDVAALGALPRLQHVSVTCGDPRVLDAAPKLRTLNLASPSLAAAHVALALRTLEATLKTASSRARRRPAATATTTTACCGPRLESLHVSHAVFGEVLLERCHQLVALSLDRCVVKRLACAAPDRRPHCPVLAELTRAVPRRLRRPGPRGGGAPRLPRAPAPARADGRLRGGLRGRHFGEMTPVKAGRGDDDDDEGDPLFELDDLDEARAPRGSVRFSEAASTPLRQPAFDDAARRRPRSAPSRTPDAPPRGTPPNATPPSSERRRSSGKAAKASRSATASADPCSNATPAAPPRGRPRRRADAAPRGHARRRVPALRQGRVDAAERQEQRPGRVRAVPRGSLLEPRLRVRDGFCAKAHKSERKLRPLLELLEDVDEFRRRRGLAAPPGSSPGGAAGPDESHSDHESEGDARLSRSPTPTSALSSSPGSSPGNARSDFGGRRRDRDDDGARLPLNTPSSRTSRRSSSTRATASTPWCSTRRGSWRCASRAATVYGASTRTCRG